MKRLISLPNIIMLVITTVLINSYMLVRLSPYTLLAILPLFLFVNLFAGFDNHKSAGKRTRICAHGTVLLAIFVCSLIPTLIWQSVVAIITLPGDYITLIASLVYCIGASAVIFWNGIICVYLTSGQMGLKWRIIGLLCGMVPVLNLVVLSGIIEVTSDEVEFEAEKEKINADPALCDLCKTKYPLVLVHGVFFRDSRLFNYWGRIPRTLKAHGATVYYGEHQSALPIVESARELTARVKLIVERSGCEKVNIIAHSKGGLDCRYAISELGLAPYVASLTTINTPHRGCVFAENLLNAVPEGVKQGVAKAYNTVLRELGDESPDFLAAVGDLTAESCGRLNDHLSLPQGIFAQSIGSVMKKPMTGQFPLNLSYRYVKNFDGENDGLVGEISFAWGEKYTLLRTDSDRGISHADMIDLTRKNIPGFDVRSFYTGLVADLKSRGL